MIHTSDRMIPHIHYGTEHIAAYAADRATSRTLLGKAGNRKQKVKHIDIESAFPTEEYEFDNRYTFIK